MSDCPWYVTAHAVDRWCALRHLDAPRGSAAWDDASDALIEYAARCWANYQAHPERTPRLTNTGAYVYRGPRPGQYRLVVSMERRPEGPKPQLVDVRR